MSSTHDNQHPLDPLLTAYLDGELDAADTARVETLLESDPSAAERLETLSRASLPFAEAFAPLLDAAPEARLDALLQEALEPPPAAAVRTGRGFIASRRGFMAAGVALLLAGGLGDRYLLSPLLEDKVAASGWRDLVAQYMTLYTPETLADIPADPARQAVELASLGSRLDLNLKPVLASLPDVELKRAQILQYDGAPLGQITWLDPHYGPMALCIVKASGGNSAPQPEERLGLQVVFWRQSGHGFMLIGKMPADVLEARASTLHSRLI